MSEAIARLMEEHRTIERALDRLDALAAETAAAPGAARQQAAALAAFFREFADRHHHAKEEAVLFELMVAAGMPRDVGPIACMMDEHEAGRALVGRLAAFADGDELARSELAEVAASFGALLRAHIQKEDSVLYPMAERMLDAAGLAELDARCAAVDAAGAAGCAPLIDAALG